VVLYPFHRIAAKTERRDRAAVRAPEVMRSRPLDVELGADRPQSILVMPLFVCAQLNGYRLCLGMRIPHQHPWIFVTAYGSDLRHV